MNWRSRSVLQIPAALIFVQKKGFVLDVFIQLILKIGSLQNFTPAVKFVFSWSSSISDQTQNISNPTSACALPPCDQTRNWSLNFPLEATASK